MHYADVSAQKLTLSVIKGSPDLRSLSPIISCRMKVWLRGTEVDFEMGILGASHYLRVALPSGIELTEVFACQKVESEAQQIYVGPLGSTGSLGPVTYSEAGVSYSFQATTRAWDANSENELQVAVEKIKSEVESQRRGLVYEFPCAPGDVSGQPPLTAILLEAQEARILVRTWHSYPNERLVVLSRTSFERKEAKANEGF